MIQKTLRAIGLSNSEIEIYLVLLEMGTTQVSTVARRIDMHRSNVRHNCDQLVEKGLVFMIKRDRTHLYTAEEPEKIKLMLQAKQREFREHEALLDQTLEDMRSGNNPNRKISKVKFYNGTAGIEALCNEILELGESEICSFEDDGGMLEMVPDFVPLFTHRRMEKGISSRVIASSANILSVSSKYNLRQVKNIPAAEFPFSCDIKILKNMVCIFSFEKEGPIALSLHYPNIAHSLQLLFDHMWLTLPEVRDVVGE